MSLKSLIASVTLGIFLTSFCLAEVVVPTAPGKSIPVDSVTTPEEEDAPLVLDSASVEPVSFISMTDVQVTPLADSAEVKFTTNIPTYATIEYGLTTALESAVTTETMTAHVETLSGLTACRTYSYRVLATDADDADLDTAREGTFTTKGCVVKKSTPVVKKPVPAPTPVVQTTVMPVEVVPDTTREELVVLPLDPVLTEEVNPEPEILLNAAPEIQDTNDSFQLAPESPDTSMMISEPIKEPVNKATEILLALLMLVLLLVALLVVKRKK